MKKLLSLSALALIVLSPPAFAQARGLNNGRPLPPQGGPTVAPQLAGFNARVFAAEVAQDGTLVAGIGATLAQRIATGAYVVRFHPTNLHTACFWTGTVADRNPGLVPVGYVTIDARVGTNNAIFVSTFDQSGNYADRPFIINIICRGR